MTALLAEQHANFKVLPYTICAEQRLAAVNIPCLRFCGGTDASIEDRVQCNEFPFITFWNSTLFRFL